MIQYNKPGNASSRISAASNPDGIGRCWTLGPLAFSYQIHGFCRISILSRWGFRRRTCKKWFWLWESMVVWGIGEGDHHFLADPSWMGAARELSRLLLRNAIKFQASFGGPRDHINMRILHPGYKAQDKRNSRNGRLWDPYVPATCRAPYPWKVYGSYRPAVSLNWIWIP